MVSDRYQLLYDGACPVCSREVLWLHRRRPDAIAAVDIAAEGFDPAIFGLYAGQVDAALYGIRPDGSVTVGMDSLREGYRLAGLSWVIAWTGWWPARPAFDAFYRSFAATGCVSAGCWAGRTMARVAAETVAGSEYLTCGLCWH